MKQSTIFNVIWQIAEQIDVSTFANYDDAREEYDWLKKCSENNHDEFICESAAGQHYRSASYYNTRGEKVTYTVYQSLIR